MSTKSIIKSLLDTDLYKLTTQQMIRKHFPTASARYKFHDRSKHQCLGHLRQEIQRQIIAMGGLSLSAEELCWLLRLEYFDPAYLAYLSEYRFNPEQVLVSFDVNGDLDITISGPWAETVLWEVPLLSIISELAAPSFPDYKTFSAATRSKCDFLDRANTRYVEFGTRRRRSFLSQAIAVEEMARGCRAGFQGTSNVLLAMFHGVPPKGSMPHEWIMGVYGYTPWNTIWGVNNTAMSLWREMYGDDSVALTDTFTSDLFFKHCHREVAEKFSGLRQDSGPPLAFLYKAVAFYQRMGIDPTTKTIVFSDGLTTNSAIAINEKARRFVEPVFGIGTHFTNDFPDYPPLNIVIKLDSVNDVPVVKLSDGRGKETGNPVEIARIKQLLEDNDAH